MKENHGMVKVAIIENGQITGWREVPAWQPAPMSPEDWSKTEVGQKLYLEKIRYLQDKGFETWDDDWYLKPCWSARSRMFFWTLKTI